jgi:hypothetical protein
MKIKKRHQPLDLSAVSGDGLNSAAQPEAGQTDDQGLDDLLDPELSLETPIGATAGDLPEVPPTRTELRVPPIGLVATEAPGLPPAWPIYLTALFVSVLWAAAPVAFAFGGEAKPGDYARALADGSLLALGLVPGDDRAAKH